MTAPSIRRIAVRQQEVDTGRGGTHLMWRVGTVTPAGVWETADEDMKGLTFTEGEAWARAGLLASITGLPVEPVDFNPDGTIKPTHPVYYTQGRAHQR